MKLHTHPEEFRELITVVANEKHISESAVERDYYIVMMLKSLADSPYADQCVFKGGTSLSKCYPGSNFKLHTVFRITEPNIHTLAAVGAFLHDLLHLCAISMM